MSGGVWVAADVDSVEDSDVLLFASELDARRAAARPNWRAWFTPFGMGVLSALENPQSEPVEVEPTDDGTCKHPRKRTWDVLGGGHGWICPDCDASSDDE